MMIRVSRVGTRNRVVLPVEVMELLGLKPGDPVFFVVRDREVHMSRSPETFAEYLRIHSEALPVLEDLEDVDPRQMRFAWQEAAGDD